jgi:hypothetical protein
MIRIQVSVFRWVPPPVQGLVKDLRVRWALEEAGLPYEELLIGPDQHTPLVAGFPVLAAYEARPAFGRALAAQIAAIDRHAPRAA